MTGSEGAIRIMSLRRGIYGGSLCHRKALVLYVKINVRMYYMLDTPGLQTHPVCHMHVIETDVEISHKQVIEQYRFLSRDLDPETTKY